ncbi:MAG: helix-turn-helix transcriptional regulator, partial [Nocardioides sp.]
MESMPRDRRSRTQLGDATRLAALGDATRRRLYEYVVAQPEPVGRNDAVTALDLAPHTVTFHLEKLVEAGLLATENRRLSGRSGPGAGRPNKLYRRAEGEVAVSLPSRSYDLVGHILATGVEAARQEGVPVEEALAAAATTEGRSLGSVSPTGEESMFLEVLAEQGYEPRVEDDTVLLSNCPFDALARSHTELVCGLNHSFVQGVADGVGCSGLDARLEPEPGQCCV